MAMQAYFDAKKRYIQERDTRIQHVLPKAITEAQEARLIDPATGLVDYSRLSNGNTRRYFKNDVAGKIEDAAKSWFRIPNAMNDPIRESMAAFGYAGMAGDEMRTMIENAGTSFTFDAFMKTGRKAYTDIIDPRLQIHQAAQLVQGDEADVRTLVGVTPARYAPHLTIPQMAGMIDWYWENMGDDPALGPAIIPNKVLEQIIRG